MKSDAWDALKGSLKECIENQQNLLQSYPENSDRILGKLSGLYLALALMDDLEED